MGLVDSTLERRDGVLHFDGASLADIAAAHGTPCWVYSKRMILDAWQAYDRAFGEHPHQVCYAVKANGNLAILALLAEAGAGFDIVSGGELARVLAAGADPGRVVFSGVGKRSDEIHEALAHDIACFNVESVGELERLADAAAAAGRRARVSVRVNPDIDVDTHPYIATGLTEHKFGLPMREAMALYRRAGAIPDLEVVGVACHIGSQIVELDPFARAARALLDFARELRGEGLHIRHLDLGGGLGLGSEGRPSPGIAAYVACLLDIVRSDDRSLDITIEPGRSIVADAGVLLTRVQYLKDNGEKHFALVDAGMNDLIRPALYDAYQPIWNVGPRDGDDGADTYDVVGPVCESADFLARGRPLNLAPGDLLAVGEAGAYGACMGSNYNARPRGAEVLVDDGVVELVRERESYADLMRGERIPGRPAAASRQSP
jgi:diaminopimelate decarboxylase